MTDEPKKPIGAPVPRDHDDATLSELMPFRSKQINLLKSPIVILILIAGIASTAMFGMMQPVLGAASPQSFEAFKVFVQLTIFVMLLMLQVAIYSYSRSDRPIWVFMIGYAMVVAILLSPLIQIFFFVFRTLLPGGIETTPQTPFLTTFISMFFGAGLMEELIKAVPTLIGAGLTIAAVKRPNLKTNIAFKYLNVRGPLDAVLMGVFAGAGFIMVETATQYVPRIALQVGNGGGNYGTGIAAGLMLLVPRVLGGAVGHMAYASINGYFIGLAILRPRRRWQLLGIGWLCAATIHALWNSVGQLNENLMYVIAVVAGVFAGAALLKARQIDATELGRENFTSGSIVVDRRQPAAGHAPAGAAPPPPRVAPVAPQATPTSTEGPLALDLDGLLLPLRSGSALDLSIEPALAGRGAGILGQIVPHPTRANVLGLQNAGDKTWTARLRDGSQQMIEKNQNIRLAPGVQIDFGGGLTGRVVPAG